jgi:hypothetical protein
MYFKINRIFSPNYPYPPRVFDRASINETVIKKLQYFSGLVLQVTKIRNVSAPKVNEESGGAPRMLKISLTDGKITVHGVEMSKIEGISLKTAPGTKVKLLKPVNLGFVFLSRLPLKRFLKTRLFKEKRLVYKNSNSIKKQRNLIFKDIVKVSSLSYD